MGVCNFKAVCVLNLNILGMGWKRMNFYGIMKSYKLLSKMNLPKGKRGDNYGHTS